MVGPSPHPLRGLYNLTDEGRRALLAEVTTWRSYVAAVSKVLETA